MSSMNTKRFRSPLKEGVPRRRATQTASVALVVTAAVLGIALLASAGMMQNSANAATKTVYKFKNSYADVLKYTTEGTTTTFADAYTYTDGSGQQYVCLNLSEWDTSTNVYSYIFHGCTPDGQVKFSGISSATYGGEITGYDYVSDTGMTVTLNADVTATGKPTTTTGGHRFSTPYYKEISHESGQIADASGSITVSGDLTHSTSDASGYIGNVKQGTITITTY